MAGPSKTQLADVLFCLYSYLNLPTDLWKLIETSKGLREACSYMLAGNVEAGKGFLTAAVDDFLGKALHVINNNSNFRFLASSNPKHPYLSKRLVPDSRACWVRIRWTLRVCGNGMLQDPLFAAELTTVIIRSTQAAGIPAEMNKAAAYVYSCLLPGGLSADYSQLLAACQAGHGHEHYAAWIKAHGRLAAALRFTAEDLEAYGIANTDDNQRILTAALVAIVRDDVPALGRQLDALSPVKSEPNPFLVADLLPVAEKLSPRGSGIIVQAVGSDGWFYLVCRAIHQPAETPCATLNLILQLPATKQIPATSQQFAKLLDELFNFPDQILRLLRTSESFAKEYTDQLHNEASRSAVAAAIRRCINEPLNPSMQQLLSALCQLYGAGRVFFEGWQLQILSSATVEELLIEVAGKLRTCPRDHIGAHSHQMRILSSLPTGHYNIDTDSLLLSVLGVVSVPGYGVQFVAVLRAILGRIRQTRYISSNTAAKILDLAEATGQSSDHVSFAAAVVMLEFSKQLRKLQRKEAATAANRLSATLPSAANPSGNCSTVRPSETLS